jgi:hypothetical protein
MAARISMESILDIPRTGSLDLNSTFTLPTSTYSTASLALARQLHGVARYEAKA